MKCNECKKQLDDKKTIKEVFSKHDELKHSWNKAGSFSHYSNICKCGSENGWLNI